MKIRLKDGSGVIDLKYLKEDVDRHGNVRLYFRRHGKKTRLHETPGTDTFMAEYRAALEGQAAETAKPQAPAAPRSLRWLIERYYQSSDFKGLTERTRRVRRGILDGLCGEKFAEEPRHGDKPFASMAPRHVRQIRDAKADFPEAANARVKALRQVFKWATDDTVRHAERNPARDVPYLRPKNPDGFHTWTIEEVRQFEARHPIGTKPRLALAIGLFSGVRRSDAVRLGPQMERNGSLRFTETKGRSRKVKEREIPILPELREAIDACPSGHLAYLVTEFGKPFTANGFGNWFRDRCNEAELPHCSFHGLRKAGATFAADNGATEHELMAIYEWDSPKQAALYTRKANRKRLAAGAMHRIVAGLTTDESGPLNSESSSGGPKKGKKA